MAENMGKWASGNRKIAKSGHRVAAEMVPFPRRWHGGMISANQGAIWANSPLGYGQSSLNRDCSIARARNGSRLMIVHRLLDHSVGPNVGLNRSWSII